MKVVAVQVLYEAIPMDDKPNQPVDWVPIIICYCVQNWLHINEIAAMDNDDNFAADPQHAGDLALPLAPRQGNEMQADLIQVYSLCF